MYLFLFSGSTGGKILNLAMSPCDDGSPPYPCILHRRTNYTMSVNFTASMFLLIVLSVVIRIIMTQPLLSDVFKKNVVMTIMLKTTFENPYWFKVGVTRVAIYCLLKLLSHSALFYDIIGSL